MPEAGLDAVDLLGVEVGDRLVALQPVQLGGLRRAEAARQRQPGRARLVEPPGQGEAWAGVGETVAAIRRPRVQAAAEAAGHAVLVGVAVEHAIVVVIAQPLEAQPRGQLEALAERAHPVQVRRRQQRLDLVVIVLARRPDGIGDRGTAGGRAVLRLLQEALGALQVQPHDQRAPGRGHGAGQQQRCALLPVALDRLAEQEVLQEVHARAAQHEPQIELLVGTAREAIVRRQSRAVRVAVGLGIRIAARERRIAIAVLADDESGGVLRQVGGVETQRQGAVARGADQACRQFLFLETGVVAPAAVARRVQGHAGLAQWGRAGGRELHPGVLVRTALEGQPERRQVRRPGVKYVDDAVHRVRAVQRAARAADHLGGGCLLAVDLEQLVDVAEADRPQRHAVFEEQEGAAGTRAGQHRRAQRGERLLAATALDQGARHAVDEFRVVGGAEQAAVVAADAREAAGKVEQTHRRAGCRDDDFRELGRGGCDREQAGGQQQRAQLQQPRPW